MGLGGERPAGRSGWDLARWFLLGALAVIAAVTLRHYGISNDEEVQHRYGELIIAYYRSGFADRSLFDYSNLYLYGGLFDIVAVLLAKLLPVDVFFIRHALCALTGLGGIAATAATARLVAGPRAGFLAAALLATTAPWYGAMFNHTKDIPFAAAMMGAVFFLLRMAGDLPRPRWSHSLAFGVLFGAACGLRAMGLLLLGYAGLLVLSDALARLRAGAGIAGAADDLARSAIRMLPGVIVGYAIMLATWPWAAQGLLNPVKAIFAFAHFQYPIRTILAGKVYEMADVPRFYVPAYLLIRLPLVALVGALAAAAFALAPGTPARRLGGAGRRAVALLWFTVLFPLTCQVIGHGPAFTGMRHFFFVVPPLVALAAIGLDTALALLAERARMAALAGAGALAAVLAWNAALLVRLHPHQYLYYNALVGGLPGAAGRYNLDYWVNIMPEAVGGLKAYLDQIKDSPPGRRYTVGICGERFSFEHERDERMQWTDGWKEADFFIAPTHMACDAANDGRVVARIVRLGVVIGVVKDRRGLAASARATAP